MPRAAECERHAKCSQSNLAYTAVEQTGWKCVGDDQCNQNEEEYGSEEKVGQNASMFDQLLYVSLQRVLVRDILCANGEQ